MKDSSKNGQALIEELASLRRSIARLEQSEANRKKAEEAQWESERRYREFFKISQDCVFVTSKDGKWIDLNDASLEMFGYESREELFQVPVSSFYVNPEELTALTALIEKQGYVREYPVQMRRRDGAVMDALISIGFRRNADAGAEYYGTIHDITQPKRAMNALWESEELYTRLVNAVPDIIVRADLDGRILFVNDYALLISGYSRGEIEGQSMLTFIAPEDRERLIKNALLMKEKGIGPIEYNLIMKDGRKIPFEVNGDVLRNEDGTPFGFVNVCRNISERKRAEEMSRLSEEKFHKVFIKAPECITITRKKDGVLIDANQGYEDILGWKRESAIGTVADEQRFNFWVDPSARDLMEEELKAGRDVLHHELKFRRADGSVRTGIYSARCVQIAGEASFIFILQDITDRKRVEEEFRRTLESLRNAVGVTIQVMVSAVEARDPYTAGHQIRSADLARAIATEMGLSQNRIDGIRMAGAIHDIGKLSIPAEILSKPTQLTELEFSLIKEHPQKGYEMLKDVESPWPLAQIVHQHHERMDGSGYPGNLRGDAIIMEARIMAVADVVESTASHRPYRPALGMEAALEEIEKNKGILYDNAVADTCLRLFRHNGYQLPLNESVHFIGNMNQQDDFAS